MTGVLDRYEALHLEATPGRWRAVPLTMNADVVQDEDGQLVAGKGGYGLRTGRANMGLIAASRNTVPAAIAFARASQAHREWMEAHHLDATGGTRTYEAFCAALDAFLSALSEEVK